MQQGLTCLRENCSWSELERPAAEAASILVAIQRPEGRCSLSVQRSEEAAEKARWNGEDERSHPSAAKADFHFAQLAARIKSVPFSKPRAEWVFSAACKVGPLQSCALSPQMHAPGAKARVDFSSFMPGINPRPTARAESRPTTRATFFSKL